MEDEHLIALLADDEARSRPFRAERLRLLLEEYGLEGIRLFPGGLISAIAFEEARQAYLHGLLIACIIMCQVCLEHMLLGLFRQSGRDNLNRTTFEKLLREARDDQLLSEDEFELFDRLRTIRNPYAHPRTPTGRGSLIRRALDEDTTIEEVFLEDSKLAIKSLLKLCQRPPFALSDSTTDI